MNRKNCSAARAGLLALAMALALGAACVFAHVPALAEEVVEPITDEAVVSSGTEAEELLADLESTDAAGELPLEPELLEPGLEEPLREPEGELIVAEEAPSAYEAPAGQIPIYRLYNWRTSEHLYTKNKAEYDGLPVITKGDWVQEWIAWNAPTTSKTPVYRLYNKRSGDHHYTSSKAEADALCAKHGWTSEGIAFYSDDARRLPLYRVYNPRLKRGQHHYTAAAQERNALTSKHGWKDEGIGFYGASANTVPAPKPDNIFMKLEANRTYYDLDFDGDNSPERFSIDYYQQNHMVTASVNYEPAATYDGRGVIAHYWRYDANNEFLILNVVRFRGYPLVVLRYERIQGNIQGNWRFSEILYVDENFRNNLVGVSGNRLTIEVGPYRYQDGPSSQIAYELNPVSHTFRRV